MFQKTPVDLPKELSYKKKRQSLLHAIGGGWFMNKINDKLPPLKKRKISKRLQEKEYEIKRNL